MPLKKGNTNIGAIYKGTTQIAKIYKGTKLLFENAKWLDYLFNYLYHSLIPTTISGKTVQDKARLTKISGNGVIENQLVQNGNFSDGTSNFTFESLTVTVSDNVLSGTTTGVNFRINQSISVIANHKYLLSYNFKLKSIAGSNSGRVLYFADSADYFPGSQTLIKTIGDTLTDYKISAFVTPTISGITMVRLVRGMSFVIGDTFDTSEIELIDLTLMFGTGNEPTTLTDNCIQALLNRGYIAYNTGSYKNSRVGEIETFNSNSQLLDTITLPGLLELNGAINSHDTFEITNTGYVFTRNVGVVDLGTQNWGYDSYSDDGTVVCVTQRITEMKELADSIGFGKGFTVVNYEVGYNSGANLISTKTYQNIVYINISQSVLTALGWDGSSTTVGSYAKTYLSGVMLYYELATPQVITIPKKHLGCVDLGSLSYTVQSSYTASSTGIQTLIARPSAYNVQANIYCGKYKSAKEGDITTSDMSIAISTSGVVLLKDSSLQGQTAQQIKSALAGIYLFYETDAEVSDFDNIAQINAGGSITSNSEVLPNVNFKIKCKTNQ